MSVLLRTESTRRAVRTLRFLLPVVCIGFSLFLMSVNVRNILGTSSPASPAYDRTGVNDSYGNKPADSGDDIRLNNAGVDPNVPIDDDSTTSGMFVVILAQFRFSSTIIGEVLNQSPDLVFFFEPLWMFTGEARILSRGLGGEMFLNKPRQPSSLEDRYRDVLRRVAKCELGKDVVTVLNAWGGRARNKAVCEHSPMSRCRIPSTTWLKGLCRRRGHVATKLIRAGLDTIKPLVVDDHTDVKVIHLVRDPRGVAVSRLQYDSVKGAHPAAPGQMSGQGRLHASGMLNYTLRGSESLPYTCKWMADNFYGGNTSTHPQPWLEGRYHLVRYEDFAHDPQQVTRQIYDFLGLPLVSSVENWVHAHTHVHQKKFDDVIFGLNRNARETAERWMTDLSSVEIAQVEEICREAMGLLGYKPYQELIQGV